MLAGMAKLELDTHVAAATEELFDLLADPSNEVDWNPDTLEVHRVGDGSVEPGSQWRGRYKGMGTMDIALEEYDRPQRLVFRTTGDRMAMRFAFDFRPAGTETDLHVDADIEPKGAMRLMGPLMGPMMRRTFAKRPQQMEAGVAKRRGAAAER
jgi:uncharacterized protein YndB with AHSA1/START domain